MDRRNFLAGILAASTAPVFIPAARLMRIKPIVVPPELAWGVWDELYLPATKRPSSCRVKVITTSFGSHPTNTFLTHPHPVW